jgi:hypothetical protein
MYQMTLRNGMLADRNLYPTPSRCWCCGRYVEGNRQWAYRHCKNCDVRWQEVLPGTNPLAPVNRDYELMKLRREYLPRGVTGRPWDNFDDFIDHGEKQLACPA